MSYVIPELVRTALILAEEAVDAVVDIAARRCIAPISGVQSTGSYGIEDLTSDPYAYLGRPGHAGREMAA